MTALPIRRRLAPAARRRHVAAFMDVAAPSSRGRSRSAAARRRAGYEHFATFHPRFLYELLFNLALAGALLILLRRGRVRPPGIFALYVTGYSSFRTFEETLRTTPPTTSSACA